jgi:ubiquinone/menaquinone biosynthesis C-methylase UbiE
MDTLQICDSNFDRKGLICPWQIAPLMDNLLRPLVHNPRKLFAPYVEEGMTVLDVGCGAGFASLGLAELVGSGGSVIAADLQPQMLRIVRKRAMRAGLSDRIHIHLCEPNRIGVREGLDFAVAFFMVHEVPDAREFIEEIFTLLKEGGKFFLIEPKIHVKSRDFQQVVNEAQAVGFKLAGRPGVRFGYTALLMKSE